MLLISATAEWRTAHPGAIVGLLEFSGVENNLASPSLDERKREVEARLHKRYDGFNRQGFLDLPVMSDYERYYKVFNKTYHVLLQVESLVLKGKNLPDVNPLVDSNFMAEVETFVLTAGHDASRLQEPIVMDVSREGDQIVQMNGTSKAIRPGDMVMRDAMGISCSIIYGQDNRSPISIGTRHVLYVVYAPAGVGLDAVQAQLHRVEENVHLFSPQAILEQFLLISA